MNEFFFSAKIVTAVIAAKFLPTLESPGYLLTMRLLAVTLVGFSLLSIVKAVELGLAMTYGS
jgi:hypothetical protein